MRALSHVSTGPEGLTPLISKEKQVLLRGNEHPKQYKKGPESHATFAKRKRKKALSQAIVGRLLPFEESRMQSQYKRAMNCGCIVEQREGKLITQYCKTRPCLVCNGIRTAMLIDAYSPIVDSWEDPALVTLTVPNVELDELRPTVDEMGHQFKLILKQLRRSGVDVKAIRVTEVTGRRGDSIHPHFHVLVSGMAVGRAILESWLKRHPKAVRAAQDVTQADTGSLKELFKYLTKLSDPKMDPEVLDGILSAMWGKHLVRPYGFKLKKDPMEDEAFEDLVPVNSEFKRFGESVVWVWHDEIENWIDYTTGELLVDGISNIPVVGFA